MEFKIGDRVLVKKELLKRAIDTQWHTSIGCDSPMNEKDWRSAEVNNFIFIIKSQLNRQGFYKVCGSDGRSVCPDLWPDNLLMPLFNSLE